MVIFAIIWVIIKVVDAHRLPPQAGPEEIAGSHAVVATRLKPKGTVLMRGEIWEAVSEDGTTIEPEEEVTVTRYENLKLWVARKTKGGSR